MADEAGGFPRFTTIFPSPSVKSDTTPSWIETTQNVCQGGLGPPQGPPVPSGPWCSAPSWVPQGAIAFFDFTAGEYWLNGVMTVADLSSIFTAEPTFGATWDPSQISAAGMAEASQPAIVGPLLALFLNPGCTSVWQVNSTPPHPGRLCYPILDSSNALPNGYTYEYVLATYDDVNLAQEPTLTAKLMVTTPTLPDGHYVNDSPPGHNFCNSGARNKVAYTWSPQQFAISTNGQSTFNAGPEAVPGDLDQLAYIFIQGHYDWLEKLTIYPVQPNSALPGLST